VLGKQSRQRRRTRPTRSKLTQTTMAGRPSRVEGKKKENRKKKSSFRFHHHHCARENRVCAAWSLRALVLDACPWGAVPGSSLPRRMRVLGALFPRHRENKVAGGRRKKAARCARRELIGWLGGGARGCGPLRAVPPPAFHAPCFATSSVVRFAFARVTLSAGVICQGRRALRSRPRDHRALDACFMTVIGRVAPACL
jgi:hypothetical protein